MCHDDTTPPRLDPGLTDRESEILCAWLMEDSKSTAAKRLYVTTSTVATTVERIRSKYSAVGRPARTKAALLARAVQDDLIDLDEL
ncbi:LuxR family transcriptional regulator [Mycolicibacterium cosmeticum]|uniref:LuxR family transcriptional regulator n=1 Tax=Mycolicibacterium cosmeticum TaxID=258533 RepID=UPI003204707D